MVSLPAKEPGAYELVLEVHDDSTGSTVSAVEPFLVESPVHCPEEAPCPTR
jgi:hypothetical protein